MNWPQRITDWLETRWLNPAYSGWLLGSLALFLFIAATNTLSGWLYVISGLIFALLTVAAILSYRNLQSLQVRRSTIPPVTAGDPIAISITLINQSSGPKSLLQIWDILPPGLGETAAQTIGQTIEHIPAQSRQTHSYNHPTTTRGIYRWQNISIRSAAPLGLFWRRRRWQERVSATVYPPIVPLQRAPIIDEMGQDLSLQVLDNRRARTSTEGMTRSLRPYRWGDPMRMIHWSTSARHGELRVREMETMTSGRSIVICLDSASTWDRDSFEQAVSAATALYFYAVKQQLNVSFWTAHTGKLRGAEQVLQVLAGVMPGEAINHPPLTEPLIWLTQNLSHLESLPAGSRWLLWQTHPVVLDSSGRTKGQIVDVTRPIGPQLTSINIG
jgi:uncharacterized protein (DUF58 family)